MPGTGKSILITGSTGNQGGAVANELLGAGYSIRAMTRKPDSQRARHLSARGATVVKGDLNDAASLERALQGAWGVLAVQNTWEAGVEGEEIQGKRLAELARRVGVQHFVYQSVASADRSTGIPHFDNKARIERTIMDLGFSSYTIIRPVFFMENWLSPWFKPAIDQGAIALAVKPGTRLQMIAVDDIGKYGRLAFERHEQLNGRAIDIAGDELTMPEVARILGEVTGRSIRFQPPPIDEVRQGNADFASMLEWFDRIGYDVDIAGMQREFGVAPTSLRTWASAQKW